MRVGRAMREKAAGDRGGRPRGRFHARGDALSAGYEERMHEVRGSLAALAGAFRVLADDGSPLMTDHRHRIGELANAELERLARLVAPPDSVSQSGTEELELDAVVEHVVTSRRLAGQVVTWQPTGRRMTARADEVMQILNILLVNAARHAPGAAAHVDVVLDGSTARVRVSDEGPGVPDELRAELFRRGRCNSTTGGQGIGLAVARSLARDLGGSLALTNAGRGATFEMTLPVHHLDGVA